MFCAASVTYPLDWLVFSLVVIFLALQLVLMFICRKHSLNDLKISEVKFSKLLLGEILSNSSKHIDDTADNTNTKDTKPCSCQQKNTCSLNGNCWISRLLHHTMKYHLHNGGDTFIMAFGRGFKLSANLCVSLYLHHFGVLQVLRCT